jgi:hypothetical protein
MFKTAIRRPLRMRDEAARNVSVAEMVIFGGAGAGARGAGGSEVSCTLEILSRAHGFAAKREGISLLTVSLAKRERSARRKDAGGTGAVGSGLPMLRSLD